MYIEVDLTTVPPQVSLREPDDFKAFKVVVLPAEHAYVSPETLTELAGSKADDAAWQEGFAAMAGYAKSAGWTRDDGAIRAHIESPPSDG